MEFDSVSHRVIGCAIEVHRALGPGLLESAYELCLAREVEMCGLAFQRELPLRVVYKGVQLDCGYRMDFVVEEKLIVELRSVERVVEVHEAQLLSYMKLSNLRVGLLINFNVAVPKDGLQRFVL